MSSTRLPRSSKDARETTPRHAARGMIALRRLVVIALATYGVVCILVCVFERRLIYFPSRELEATPRDIGLNFADVVFRAEDDVELNGWYIPRANATYTALFCHGNAGNISDRLNTIQTLHELGYNVFIFDYRGYGRSAGTPSEKGLYRDAQAAWNYLTTTRGESAERILLVGRSLGGAVAIELAGRHRPRALIVESTFSELADVGRIHYPLLPVRLILRDRFASIERIAAITCPKLFLHGLDDTLIPIALGRRLFEAAANPKIFIETPGGHNEAGFTYSPEYALQLADFVANL